MWLLDEGIWTRIENNIPDVVKYGYFSFSIIECKLCIIFCKHIFKYNTPVAFSDWKRIPIYLPET